MLNHSLALDRTFHALAASSRRAILQRLSRGPAPVKELAGPLEISLAATIQHLDVLEECGLVRSDKAGRVRTCRLSPEGLSAAERWLSDHRATWERHFDALGEFLAKEEQPEKSAAKSKPQSKSRKARR